MNDETLKFFLRALEDGKSVADVLPEGYNLAIVYLRLGQSAQAVQILKTVSASLRILAEKTDAIASSLTGKV